MGKDKKDEESGFAASEGGNFGSEWDLGSSDLNSDIFGNPQWGNRETQQSESLAVSAEEYLLDKSHLVVRFIPRDGRVNDGIIALLNAVNEAAADLSAEEGEEYRLELNYLGQGSIFLGFIFVGGAKAAVATAAAVSPYIVGAAAVVGPVAVLNETAKAIYGKFVGDAAGKVAEKLGGKKKPDESDAPVAKTEIHVEMGSFKILYKRG